MSDSDKINQIIQKCDQMLDGNAEVDHTWDDPEHPNYAPESYAWAEGARTAIYQILEILQPGMNNHILHMGEEPQEGAKQ